MREIEAAFTRAEKMIADRDAEIERLWNVLEYITRECNALNKGPVAVRIAQTALEESRRALGAYEQKAPNCLECKDGLPSTNWKDGKPYDYCPECGRQS